VIARVAAYTAWPKYSKLGALGKQAKGEK